MCYLSINGRFVHFLIWIFKLHAHRKPGQEMQHSHLRSNAHPTRPLSCHYRFLSASWLLETEIRFVCFSILCKWNNKCSFVLLLRISLWGAYHCKYCWKCTPSSVQYCANLLSQLCYWWIIGVASILGPLKNDAVDRHSELFSRIGFLEMNSQMNFWQGF